MIGAVVGVGVFGLPYAFAQSGFALGLVELVIMAVLLTILQLMFAEVAIQTGGHHRLVGYAKKYIGKPWGKVALVAMASGIWGAMLAYIVVGGKFLHILLEPVFGGPEMLYAILIAVISSALIYRGLAFASKIEVAVVVSLLFLFVFIILASLPHIEAVNYFTLDLKNAFVPYGVILFSLAGIGIVPEMRDVLGVKESKKLPHAIIIGMLVITGLYALFAFAVVGVTGPETTQAAFDGLTPILGGLMQLVATFLGSLIIISIYMVLGIELLNTLRFDFKMKHKAAWSLVVFVPIILYLLGLRELISIIGFVGAVFSGVMGILVVLTYLRMKNSPICKEHKCINFPNALSWLIIALFAGGVVLQIVTALIN